MCRRRAAGPQQGCLSQGFCLCLMRLQIGDHPVHSFNLCSEASQGSHLHSMCDLWRRHKSSQIHRGEAVRQVLLSPRMTALGIATANRSMKYASKSEHSGLTQFATLVLICQVADSWARRAWNAAAFCQRSTLCPLSF